MAQVSAGFDCGLQPPLAGLQRAVGRLGPALLPRYRVRVRYERSERLPWSGRTSASQTRTAMRAIASFYQEQ
jgi:hypothetical protein